jgi:hypothetical protein
MVQIIAKGEAGAALSQGFHPRTPKIQLNLIVPTYLNHLILKQHDLMELSYFFNQNCCYNKYNDHNR